MGILFHFCAALAMLNPCLELSLGVPCLPYQMGGRCKPQLLFQVTSV